MDFLKQAAAVAGKAATEQKPAEAAPAPAAEATPATPAQPDAAAPVDQAAAPAAAPVDIKSSLMHAVEEFKTGDYKGAASDVLSTGLVQKFAKDHAGQVPGGKGEMVGQLLGKAEAALGAKPADPNAPAPAAPGTGDLMGSLGGLVSGFGKK